MTRMFVVRHGATSPNLEKPYRLQGRGIDVDLAPQGVEQAERVRNALSGQSLQAIYSSPLRRARQTAEIIAAGHNLTVQLVTDLQEGDVGRWEGRTWEDIRAQDAEACERFMANPAEHGYPGGESFQDVAERVTPVFHDILQRHQGQTVLVVSHQIVCRVYLAGLLGLAPGHARRVKLANGGLSVVRLEEGQPELWTLNSTLHL